MLQGMVSSRPVALGSGKAPRYTARVNIPGYQVLAPIGQGGMATALLAVQTSLGRKVVLKLLDTRAHTGSETVERFLNEGRLVASLSHPNIVHVYDVGIADGHVYLSMEYIEGGDLRARLGQPVGPREALEIVRQVAQGLEVAHRNGIVHRDVKPANILFRKDGTPVLSDFGIAKRLTVDQDLTSTGVFLGSPNYMAPEQAQQGVVDGRADIYALGVILYEMFTGTKPFQSDSVLEVILKHRNEPVPRLPPELATYQPLLDLMLAKNRNQRFRDCDSMVHYIRELQGHESPTLTDLPAALPLPPGAQRPASLSLTQSRHFARRRLPTGLAIGLVVALGFFMGIELAARYGLPEASDIPPRTAVRAAPPTEPPPPPDGAPATPEVIQALVWLGKNSLVDYRLTEPPRDNAHYYFARLLQLDPDNPEGIAGMQRVAERFAVLAEREIANGDHALAREYLDIAQQLDPGNPVQRSLRQRLQAENEAGRRGWFGW
jgi:serine/threonine-protein kinase PpkA